MLFADKKPQGHKEYVIQLILFSFVESVIVIYWLADMKLYVSKIGESYKDTIIGNLVNSGAEYLL